MSCNVISEKYSFFSVIYPPQPRIYTPGTYNPNVFGSDAYRESKRLLTRTLDIHKGVPP